MLLAQHKGTPALLEPSFVSFQNGICRLLRLHCQALFARRYDGTDRQPDQVERVGVQTRLIEIVHAPHQPSIGVAPSPEVLHVQIAHRQDARRVP
jgi:hypothetical protein